MAARHYAPLEERIWQKVAVGDWLDCWVWTASTSVSGYGEVHADGKTRKAHRVLYELMVGPIPDGMHLDHTCHTADRSCLGGNDCLHRRCVSPFHMDVVTPEENTRRGRSGIREALKTHCPQGHEYAGDNVIVRCGRRHCGACNADRSYLIRDDRHGTMTNYSYGCRCDPCRQVMCEYDANRQGRCR